MLLIRNFFCLHIPLRQLAEALPQCEIKLKVSDTKDSFQRGLSIYSYPRCASTKGSGTACLEHNLFL